jgi:hypothetical protein
MSTMNGCGCWDQVAEGCLIPDTENAKVSITRWAVINAVDPSPKGIPEEVYL